MSYKKKRRYDLTRRDGTETGNTRKITASDAVFKIYVVH